MPWMKPLIKGLKTVHDISDLATQNLMKEILRRTLAASHLLPKSVGLNLKAVVGISFNFDLQAVLDHVRAWAEKPPTSTDDLKQFILDLAPSDVTFSGGAEWSTVITVGG